MLQEFAVITIQYGAAFATECLGTILDGHLFMKRMAFGANDQTI